MNPPASERVMPDAPTDQPDDAVMAALLRAVLTLGVATPADLVPWADEQIRVRDRPPEWIIDVALSGSLPADRVLGNLPDLWGRDYPPSVFGFVVGLIDHDVVGWTYPRAHSAAAWLLQAAQCLASEETRFVIDAIDDSFSLCEQGMYGEPQALVAYLAEFVQQHADGTARQWLPSVRVTFER